MRNTIIIVLVLAIIIAAGLLVYVVTQTQEPHTATVHTDDATLDTSDIPLPDETQLPPPPLPPDITVSEALEIIENSQKAAAYETVLE